MLPGRPISFGRSFGLNRSLPGPVLRSGTSKKKIETIDKKIEKIDKLICLFEKLKVRQNRNFEQILKK